MSRLARNRAPEGKRRQPPSAPFGYVVPGTDLFSGVRWQVAVGFSTHWSWIWLVFWSSLFYSNYSHQNLVHESLLLEPLWTISLLTNAAGPILILYFLTRRRTPWRNAPSARGPQVLGQHLAPVVLAAVLTSVGTLIVAEPASIFSPAAMNVAYVAGASLTGFGSAIAFVLWGEALTVQGSRSALVYNVLAMLIGAATYLVFMLLPAGFARFATGLLPIAGMALFWKNRSIVGAYQPPSSPSDRGLAKTQIRENVLSITAISLFFGISYGVMKGAFVLEESALIEIRDALNVASFVLGALAILITTRAFDMDFGKLTYQVALPLMAGGFLFITLDHPLPLLGFSLHQVGYQYFYIVIWALWPVLARNNPSAPPALFPCFAVFGMQAGQLLGSVIGSAIMPVGSISPEALHMETSVAIFVILLVALFGFGNSRSGWGLINPMSQESSLPKFKRTCQQLAATHGLSKRETEVFLLLAKGRNCARICETLVIAEPTAKTHIKNVYHKMGVHSQQDLLDMIESEGAN